MDECFICGALGSQVRLFDAVSDNGIIKICERCSEEERIPVIRRPTTFQLKESERRHSVYEKLHSASGIKIPESRSSLSGKQEPTMRELVERNLENRVPKEVGPRPDMVDNFHWIIMRARRFKKLTQEQLAREIGESSAAVAMAEKGILPEDDYRLVDKLERYLNVKLVRDEFAKERRTSERPKRLSFDIPTSKNLTIADVKQMKKEKETGMRKEEVLEEEPGDVKEVEGLSKEDMDKISFRR